jgi:hypothetical protein
MKQEMRTDRHIRKGWVCVRYNEDKYHNRGFNKVSRWCSELESEGTFYMSGTKVWFTNPHDATMFRLWLDF